MQFAQLKRREFITLLGGSVMWPATARAQQPAMPVIGYLDSRSPDVVVGRLRAFRQGLKEAGFVEGESDEAAALAREVENPAALVAAIKEKGVLSGKRIERSERGAPGE